MAGLLLMLVALRRLRRRDLRSMTHLLSLLVVIPIAGLIPLFIFRRDAGSGEASRHYHDCRGAGRLDMDAGAIQGG